MKVFILLLLLFVFKVAEAQVYTGGNVGVNYRNGLFVDFSPLVGYQLEEYHVNVGVAPVVSYSRVYDSPARYSYGGRAFGQYLVTKDFFTHAEINLLNVPGYNDRTMGSRIWILSLPIGGGYQYKIGPGVMFQAMVLYDILVGPSSPNENPIVRMGVNYSF
ncbi:MAG: hypothetical protein ACK4ND_00915 [Cytophagaceae bacterium]